MAPSDTTVSPHSPSGTGSSGWLNPANPAYKWWVAFTVTLSSFLVTMSQNAVQVALPPIMDQRAHLNEYAVQYIAVPLLLKPLYLRATFHSDDGHNSPLTIEIVPKSSPDLCSRQFVQQRLRILQIGRIKTFCKPTIDFRQQFAGLSPLALLLPQAREAHSGAQL